MCVCVYIYNIYTYTYTYIYGCPSPTASERHRPFPISAQGVFRRPGLSFHHKRPFRSFGGLGCCSCRVRVCRCRGCCSLSVSPCVCDLLILLPQA